MGVDEIAKVIFTIIWFLANVWITSADWVAAQHRVDKEVFEAEANKKAENLRAEDTQVSEIRKVVAEKEAQVLAAQAQFEEEKLIPVRCQR